MLVTSVSRTVLDLARTISFRSAVVAADRARTIDFRYRTEPLASLECLLEELELVPRRSGRMRAERVITASTCLAGSPGESLSRVMFLELNVPMPVLQRRFVDREGELFTDFYWLEFDSIGEFDGKQKYFQPRYAAHLSPEQILWKEKLRQDRLIAFTPRIARWGWAIANDPRSLVARLATIGVHPIR
jgi:hypothetical protein